MPCHSLCSLRDFNSWNPATILVGSSSVCGEVLIERNQCPLTRLSSQPAVIINLPAVWVRHLESSSISAKSSSFIVLPKITSFLSSFFWDGCRTRLEAVFWSWRFRIRKHCSSSGWSSYWSNLLWCFFFSRNPCLFAQVTHKPSYVSILRIFIVWLCIVL